MEMLQTDAERKEFENSRCTDLMLVNALEVVSVSGKGWNTGKVLVRPCVSRLRPTAFQV